MSAPYGNCNVTVDSPSCEMERMNRTPLRSVIRSSIGLEKYVAVSSAEYPGVIVTTETSGLGTYGIMRVGRKYIPAASAAMTSAR